jgi:hypothetical protein
MIQFSSQQKEAIKAGARKRQSLQNQTKKVADRVLGKTRDEYLDSILSGTTGIGKTYLSENALKEAKIPHLKLQGSTSMFAFAGDLMLIHSRKPVGEKMVILVDDCDSFFENKTNMNILKGMTGKPGSRVFQYKKKITESNFTDAQIEVMPNYMNDGQHGFTVNCDDFVFLFTTNFPFPSEAEAKEYSSKNRGSAKGNRMMDLAAVAGRMNYRDFTLQNKIENWGWIAEVGLNDGGLDMLESESDKLILLDWMWNNWSELRGTSLRIMEQLAYEMIDYPNDYRDEWEASYLA